MRVEGPPAVLSPGDVVQGYTVVRQLDRGGFGTVYLAMNDGQACALKLVERRRVEGRVEKEVSILLRLRHPNVVGLRGFSYWRAGERDFALIAMEYVEGRKLGEWVRVENPSARRVAEVTLDVARALEASHAAGVVHRDVKDANVMVRGADGLAVLVDYGIGDYRGAPGVTQSLLPPGTLEYRPPEAWRFWKQHLGQPSSARYVSAPSDDMWALGIVLYRLLTARWPFDSGSDAEYVEGVMGRSPVPPHLVNRFVPEPLGVLCMRLLEKEPSARSDASAACAALEAFLSGADGEAWRTPLFEAEGPNAATTENEGKVDGFARWARRPLRNLRRGRGLGPELLEEVVPVEARPPSLVLEAGAEAAPVAESPRAEPVAPVVEVARRPFLSRPRMGRGLGVALLAAALAAGGLLSQRAPQSPALSVPGQEVAAPAKKPQAAPAAAPTGPEATPAAVAPSAMMTEVTAAVTTPKSDTPSSSPAPARKVTKSAGVALSVTALCTTLACSGAQVRPAPEPEPCPEGAVEGMRKLGMKIGGMSEGASFLRGEQKFVTVREGPAQIILGSDMATLSGRIFVADRVYVRLTRARFRGESFPVCLEGEDTSGNLGLALKEGGGDSGKARVYSGFYVRAVSEFE
ncbi:serine/threonine-protein kinase [Myxococcus sp. AB025B]|uniref:serine/threonine-protein kinase n=1 Tax=Myxococcus sp. AB025B TaxID=2562794 RepID=UPI00114379E7|nr:serine/threonine-protein kinase [Myxococcus sp. AB025B]